MDGDLPIRGATVTITHEVAVDLEAVRQVYALRPLSQELVSLLNPEVSLTDLAQDISEVGYPHPDQEPT
ncbi:hypothetical protein [Streptomyces sp. NPDC001401]|uniref:hypothetical protein n=1 Tax=Streptomyces sp. NPDC001401 TaxID=3364570 RepID=UPI003678A511